MVTKKRSKTSEDHKKAEGSKKSKSSGMNSWMIVSAVLAVAVIILAVMSFTGGVSKAKAGQIVLNVAKQQLGDDVSLQKVVTSGDNFYKVTLAYKGQVSDIYITKDGELLAAGVTPVSALLKAEEKKETPEQDNNVPKSDKPEVELFVMSYCPFGTQAMKGILPTIRALGDKIDFKLRFVNYAMHGEKEVWQNAQMYCIQENEGEDKLLDYLECYLGTTAGTEEESKACREKVGIDEAKLDKCVSDLDKEYKLSENIANPSGRFPKFLVEDDLNQKYGVKGSPTLVVNGKIVSSARSPSAYLDVICEAFNNAPEECSSDLSSASPSPGFGWTEGSDTGSAAQCG